MAARETAVGIAMDLRRAGHEAYLAGGCVRDEALARSPKDWDVATSATPEEVAGLFRNTRAVGEAFGVMLVHRDGFVTEVATFRTDFAYTDGRRPDRVEFTTAERDAERRDFTVNGLFRDPETNEVVDFVNGRADLDGGIIRAIGSPEARFAEDHLRLLRAVRFAASLAFEIEPVTAAAIRVGAARLDGVSRERVGDELRRMLGDASAVRAASLLDDLGLDEAVLGPGQAGSYAHLTCAVETGLDHAGCLAAVACDRRVSAETVRTAWTTSLMLSNAHRDGAVAIMQTMADLAGWNDMTVACRRRTAGRDRAADALVLLVPEEYVLAEAVTAAIAGWGGQVLPQRLVTGAHLLEAGVPAGPQLGTWLEAIYDAQLEDRVQDHNEGMAMLADLRKSSR